MIGLIAVDGVFVHCTGSPAVISTDAVDIQINIYIDKIPYGQILRMPRLFKVVFAIRPYSETQWLQSGNFYRRPVAACYREPAYIGAVGII